MARPWFFGLMLAAVASAGAMMITASQGERPASLIVALAFSLTAIVAAVVFNRVHWDRAAAGGTASVVSCARGNAILLALTFGWGALVFLCVYAMTALWWWHSWQYGSAMFGLAVVLALYAWMISDPLRVAGGLWMLDACAVLGVGVGVCAAVGIAFLVDSGKLLTVKPDWPANHVFLAGGLAVSCISSLAAATHFRLRSRG